MLIRNRPRAPARTKRRYEISAHHYMRCTSNRPVENPRLPRQVGLHCRSASYNSPFLLFSRAREIKTRSPAGAQRRRKRMLPTSQVGSKRPFSVNHAPSSPSKRVRPEDSGSSGISSRGGADEKNAVKQQVVLTKKRYKEKKAPVTAPQTTAAIPNPTRNPQEERSKRETSFPSHSSASAQMPSPDVKTIAAHQPPHPQRTPIPPMGQGFPPGFRPNPPSFQEVTAQMDRLLDYLVQ
jgi:hypothetical protein